MPKKIAKIFIKEKGCPKCHKVLKDSKVLKDKEVEFQVYDVDTVDGLAEASYYGVMSTPAIVRVNKQGEEVSRHVDLDGFIKNGG